MLVLISFSLSLMKFINLLMMALKSAVFLDISKAFGKVWHKGFIFKLKQNGKTDKILNTYYH